MKLLASMIFIGSYDDVCASPQTNEGLRSGCDATEMIAWENGMNEWKIDQNRWRSEFNKWMCENGEDCDENLDNDTHINASENIAQHVLDMKTYILDNSIEIDWTDENFRKLFITWGFEGLEKTNVESVYNSIATVFARNADQNFSVEDLFDIFLNVDTYNRFLNQRMVALGIDPENTVTMTEKNRRKLFDLNAVYAFVFGFFENSEFQDKINVLLDNQDPFIINWYNQNLANEATKEWIKQAMPINACLELLEFFENIVMNVVRDLGSDWSTAFVMNLINCISIDDLKTLSTNGNDTWLDDLIKTDSDKSRCIARVQRNLNIFGIEASMIHEQAS